MKPLADIRVVDLTRIIAGPFCAMLLGDLGADVVKIEGPQDGDPIRNIGARVNELSWYFAGFNRNKRSVVLDLRSPEGFATLEKMIAHADVLLQNYRPGVLDEMGLTAQRLEQLNPRLIVAGINGYGSTGPYADRPAFDFVVQAMSGFLSVNGNEGDPPLRTGTPISDIMAGLYTALGIVSAVRARDLDRQHGGAGSGQRVEASMLGALMSSFAYLASDHLATGELPQRTGNDHPIASPYGLFEASDGQIAVAPSTQAVLDKFLRVIGLPQLCSDPRFATNALRRANRPELNALINAQVRNGTRAHWVARLNDAGVPCGIVQNLAQALNDPQVLHQELVIEVDHPGHGPVRMLGFPVKFSGTPCEVSRPAPRHGEHTAQVMLEWGITPNKEPQ
jgi:CoA:oxalate CoA-transferase